jgi:hypothetical protein
MLLFILFVVSTWAHDDPQVLSTAEEVVCARSNLYVSIGSWHKTLLDDGLVSVCNEILEKYVNQSYTNLSWDATNEITHCLVREAWLKTRHENDSSTCDVMMREYNNWTEIDTLSKRTLSECADGYILAATVRQLKGLAWIPLDLFTYPMRKWLIMAEMGAKLEGVSEQYTQDQASSLVGLQDPEYQKKWVDRGFYCGHYEKIVDEPSLAFFRKTHNLASYIVWNFDTEGEFLRDFFESLLKEIHPEVRNIFIELFEMISYASRFGSAWRKFDDRMHAFFQVER